MARVGLRIIFGSCRIANIMICGALTQSRKLLRHHSCVLCGIDYLADCALSVFLGILCVFSGWNEWYFLLGEHYFAVSSKYRATFLISGLIKADGTTSETIWVLVSMLIKWKEGRYTYTVHPFPEGTFSLLISWSAGVQYHSQRPMLKRLFLVAWLSITWLVS